MKNTTIQLPELKVNVATSALFIARQVIEGVARDFKPVLALIIPEADAIRLDGSSYTGSVEAVIADFMRKPANVSTQLYKAVRRYQELCDKLGANLKAFEEDGAAKSAAMSECAMAMCAAARAAAQLNLQAWYDANQLPRVIDCCIPVRQAQEFFDHYGRLTWGADVVRVPYRFTLDRPDNPAADVLRLVDAQMRSWATAQHRYSEMAKALAHYL